MKKVVRLEKPILKSKYTEIVTEMTKRNIGKPVAYGTVISSGDIVTITFNPENFDATSALLSDLDIKFSVL